MSPFIGRMLTPPPPRLSGRYSPRLKSCCVVVMLVEHIDKILPLKHVDKYKDDFPVICKEEY